MADRAFVELVQRLTEAFGQQMGESRETPQGLLLRTTDGFLYSFVDDANELSLAEAQRWIAETPGGAQRLVVFARGPLPPAIAATLLEGRATVVEGGRFLELCRSLGLGAYLGDEPRPGEPTRGRLLPSAHLLDAILSRARTWSEWGVPAVALRFYRQAHDLKPGFLPARVGIGTSLLRLGLLPESEQAFREVLRVDGGNLEARLGLAAVEGAKGHPEIEVAEYRKILGEQPENLAVRAHLIAALIDHHHWTAARGELAWMLEKLPEDPRLRFLHAATLGHEGSVKEAESERARARALGLSFAEERQLCLHLGLPPPTPPEPPPSPEAVPEPERPSRRAVRPRPTPRAARSRASAPAPAPASAKPRRGRAAAPGRRRDGAGPRAGRKRK